MPLVLKGVSFSVRPGEKVGVLGLLTTAPVLPAASYGFPSSNPHLRH